LHCSQAIWTLDRDFKEKNKINQDQSHKTGFFSRQQANQEIKKQGDSGKICLFHASSSVRNAKCMASSSFQSNFSIAICSTGTD
jgi:hypothetical protein